jgi:hypothetical protein
LFGVSLTFINGHIPNISELQTLGCADGYTGRLGSLIYPSFTVIAFYHFADFGIPLRCAPGTCGHTHFAAYTQVMVYKNNAVFFAFLHGTGGAGCHAPGRFTVKAGHEDISGFG